MIGRLLWGLLAGAMLWFAMWCARAPAYSGPRSDHFDGSRFFQGDGEAARKNWRDFLRWQGERAPAAWPDWVDNTAVPQLEPPLEIGQARVTYILHSGFLLQLQGVNLLMDPLYSSRAGPGGVLGPRCVRAPGVPFPQLPPIDVVLISHDHYDHLDLPTLQKLERSFAPVFVVGLGLAGFLRERGLSQVVELDWWQDYQWKSALRIHFAPAQHHSGRRPFGFRKTLWGSFVIEHGALRIFHAGDTGYGPHFRSIRARYGPMDLALLPIGAYEPRWFMRFVHMNPEDAVEAHLDLDARHSIGMHFGSLVGLTDEAFEEPPARLHRACAEHPRFRGSFETLDCGESFLLHAAK